MTLKAGISGLRGTIDNQAENLTPATLLSYVQAFGQWLRAQYSRPAVALGRDGRNSSPMIADLARAGLLSVGCQVVDLGLTLTPTLQFTVSRGAALHGGVMVTASHNPPPWNGLKFLDSAGFFLSESDWRALERQRQKLHAPEVPLDQVATVTPYPDAFIAHQNAVLSILPVEQIRARRFRVALDACNSGAVLWQGFLQALGCDVIACHTELHGYFSREPEPLPTHLETVRRLVRAAHCDVGFAADPDGDRLVLVDEQGNAVSEEHTVVLCAQERLHRYPGGPIVVNVVTTHALESLSPHANIIRTAVGERHVVAGVQAHQAILGGEGSGGVIVPQVHLARDGLGAMGLILSWLATTGRTLSELVQALPPWQSVKLKLAPAGASTEPLRQLFQQWQQKSPPVTTQPQRLVIGQGQQAITLAVSGEQLVVEIHCGPSPVMAQAHHPRLSHLWQALDFSALTLDTTDGIKLATPNAWLSLRPSNTEPILRVMGEYRN
ncbi:MAG: hypothetical protein NZL92_11070 [Gloeomargarita sp. SKYG116]|nr:hypothetical protein [Gloeomargarita sp. SKYG116]MDW8402224.1 hypothetical protein [Gloeomargarita sp. SKYGB_i_bin116]